MPAIEPETEAAARRIDDEQHVNHGEEDVIPGPFTGVAIESEPKVQRVERRHERDEPHAEAEDERNCEAKLGQEHSGSMILRFGR